MSSRYPTSLQPELPLRARQGAGKLEGLGAIDDDSWATASLVIRSDSTRPEEITEQLALQPTRVSRAGEPVSARRPRGPKRQINVWVFTSGLPSSATADSHVAAIIEIFSPLAERLRSLPHDCHVEVSLGLTAAGLGRVHDLDAATVAAIAAIGAGLAVDLYARTP